MKEEFANSTENEFYLTDLVDVQTLQSIQDSFANMFGISASTTDAAGVPVTKGSNFSEFCEKYNRGTEIGFECCKQCGKLGAEEAFRNGKSKVYICHSGLMDFAAPIMVNGQMVGRFVGGQVLPQEAQKEHFYKVAQKLGVDPEEYYNAAKKVKVLPKETLDKAADFLYSIANILSDMAYSKYLAHKATEEIMKASSMKSDFLANVSHEIRTPMNAVIGMAEMALREELTPAAREYIQQIKTSGQMLLTIINDVLDFSKIESGKMNIIEDEYEMMSMLHDIIGIIMTRLKGKTVELIIDVVPDLPERLYGDIKRNKQILLNLANNATKFTNSGYVAIHVGYEILNEYEVELQVSVEDTGIGIKKEELNLLFESFQQLDSKRNRNIEGTGLGLAITKQLLALMHGSISVESVYNQGSTFSYKLPQKIVVHNKGIVVEDAAEICIFGVGFDTIVQQQIAIDAKRLGASYELISKVDSIDVEHIGEKGFLFIEQQYFTPYVEKFVRLNPKLTAVLIVDFEATTESDIPNLRIVKKPVYAYNLALLLKNKEAIRKVNYIEENSFDFIAPSAKVLIVDDNPINLAVAEGLLEPLQLNVATAGGGIEAIDKVSTNHYDLILMDHMMPELDGVETTHIIRRFNEEYKDVPIIMLTANAVDGTKQMFLQEGANDFVAKPIEVHVLVSAIKRWLPEEKIQKVQHFQTVPIAQAQAEASIVVADLDTKTAIKRLGSEKLFWNVLQNYYKAIEKKTKAIQEALEQSDWGKYTIEVHALKSTSKQIGADELSEMAAKLEAAGKARNIEMIRQETGGLLERYLQYSAILEQYFPETETIDEKKEKINREFLEECFLMLRQAIDDLNMIQMEEIVKDIGQYGLEETDDVFFQQLISAIEEYDASTCENILNEWKESRNH